ncbi:MAG: DUF2085 domain-containing protein [Anaerolineae bacterium]|nr:MAG: DUF2085 domain-containing protein [Anaerolineae bacterium]
MMLTVTLYTRSNCSLCDEVKRDLDALQGQYPHRLVEVDIESDSSLFQEYRFEIPVVEVGPYRLKAPISKQELVIALGAAQDRLTQLNRLGDEKHRARLRRGRSITWADRFSFWLSRHYLALINLLMFIYVGLPFLAPVLMKSGATAPANLIYTAYSPLCHQLSFRSWFLFGQQAYYPRAAAGIEGVQTFDQAIGVEDNGEASFFLQARRFRGNETLGYKVALCERDVAIYGAMLLFGLLYALTGRRLRPLHAALWLLAGWVPIGLDGFSQLFSQMNIPLLTTILPYRESTPFLRTLTGFLFGFTTAWFAYPYLEETMRETRQILLKKFAAVQTAG